MSYGKRMGGGSYSKLKKGGPGDPPKKKKVQSGKGAGVLPSKGTPEGDRAAAASKAEHLRKVEYVNQNKNQPGPGGRPLGEKGAAEKYEHEKWKKSSAGRGYFSK